MSRAVHPRAGRPTVAELVAAVAAAESLAAVLRGLGRPDNGGQRVLLKRWIAEAHLDTGHFLGQAHQRGKPGTTPPLRAEDVLVKHDGKRRRKAEHLRRALAETGRARECAACGIRAEWRGLPMTLEVDHINGDWGDDRARNLRLLCPNCHAVTRTWCRGGHRRSEA
ncbi:HNH endonuclease signature motif containing protein [Streptomyces marianii]|uniref:HNH endonuclease signature motif containing protein n=1 Tax=Streptomyces marianii TaxID=1817406 RepID=UPI002682D089|nr:HNH endonuclease [Streptomyces marianii]